VLSIDDVSRTARLACACRALDQGRIIARVDTAARDLAGEEALAHAASLPALVTGIALRTRWLDDHVIAFAADRIGPQVVLVGAGLDTRARRLGLESASFFEIDLPGMLAYKREALGPTAGQHLCPADLRVERVAEVLARTPAFDPTAPTCAIWEGVSYYLPAPAVGGVLDDLAALIGDDGLLLFDYVRSRWVQAATRADAEVLVQIARWGEPMIFGFDDLSAQLAEHGLAVIEDVATEELLPRYGFPPAGERWYSGRMAAARRGR
jgi:methyltransferase (TIGR00027 family)